MSKNPFSNRKNRYSIRKFTVGTASIIIGATLLFGVDKDAEAAEDDSYSQDVSKDASNSNDDQVETKSNQTEINNKDTQAATKSLNTTEEVATQPSEKERPLKNEVEDATEFNSTQISEANRDTKVNAQTTATESSDKIDESNSNFNSEKISSETIDSVSSSEAITKEKAKDITSSKEVTRGGENNVLSSNKVANDENLLEAVSNNKKNKVLSSETTSNLPTSNEVSVKNTSNTITNSSFRARALTEETSTTTVGTNNFTEYGDITHDVFPDEFGNKNITSFNKRTNTSKGTNGALQYNKKINFNKNFKITVPIANNNQGNTTGSNGWGFIFTTKNAQDYLSEGGILRDKGLANAAGFKIDTSYNYQDAIDKDKNKNLRQIGGVKIGYGTFVANDSNGTTQQVGSLGSGKDVPPNKIEYADNTVNQNDGKFHGQQLNDVVLDYDAENETITATYAGKT